MIFDFECFAKIAVSAYDERNPYSLKWKNPYSLQECLGVFHCYLRTYEEYMGRPHPPIRREQIARIMQEMPWVHEEDRGNYLSDIEPEEYPLLISLHFKTRYKRCDYNINHFFSGRIRELRLYENMAGYE